MPSLQSLSDYLNPKPLTATPPEQLLAPIADEKTRQTVADFLGKEKRRGTSTSPAASFGPPGPAFDAVQAALYPGEAPPENSVMANGANPPQEQHQVQPDQGTGGAGSASMPAAPTPGEDELAATQKKAAQDAGMSHTGALFDRAGRAIAGLAPDDGVFARAEEGAQQRVRDLLVRRDAARQAEADGQAKALRDPGSDASRRFQMLAMAKGWATPDQAKTLTAADFPMMDKFASYDEAKARLASEEKRGQSELNAHAREGSLNRANALQLERERGRTELDKERMAANARAAAAGGKVDAKQQEHTQALQEAREEVDAYKQALQDPNTPNQTLRDHYDALVEKLRNIGKRSPGRGAFANALLDRVPNAGSLTGKLKDFVGYQHPDVALKNIGAELDREVGLSGGAPPAAGGTGEKRYDLGSGKVGIYRPDGTAVVRYPDGREEPYRG